MKKLKAKDALATMNKFSTLVQANYENLDFILPGFPIGTVGSLVAAGGSGKSIFALQQGLSIALGRDDLTRGQVLYLPAEDPMTEVGKRLQAIARMWKLTPEQIATADANFHVLSMLGMQPDLLQVEDDQYILSELVKGVAGALSPKSQDGLRLIIFDTLRRFNFADENDGGQMAKVLGIMEMICVHLSCSCMFLHHTSKAAALGGQTDAQQASRGSSVLVDNIRFQQYLSPMSKEEADKMATAAAPSILIGEDNRKFFVRWGISKQNYGAPVPDVWYQRLDGGILMPVELVTQEKRKKGKGGGDYGE